MSRQVYLEEKLVTMNNFITIRNRNSLQEFALITKLNPGIVELDFEFIANKIEQLVLIPVNEQKRRRTLGSGNRDFVSIGCGLCTFEKLLDDSLFRRYNINFIGIDPDPTSWYRQDQSKDISSISPYRTIEYSTINDIEKEDLRELQLNCILFLNWITPWQSRKMSLIHYDVEAILKLLPKYIISIHATNGTTNFNGYDTFLQDLENKNIYELLLQYKIKSSYIIDTHYEFKILKLMTQRAPSQRDISQIKIDLFDQIIHVYKNNFKDELETEADAKAIGRDQQSQQILRTLNQRLRQQQRIMRSFYE